MWILKNSKDWYADDLLKQCSSKGDKYVIDEELQHTDHLFRKVHSGIINLFDERIVYSSDKDSVCSKRGTTEIL
jgi:hypothetical protein